MTLSLTLTGFILVGIHLAVNAMPGMSKHLVLRHHVALQALCRSLGYSFCYALLMMNCSGCCSRICSAWYRGRSFYPRLR